jgi:hypothetical protein
MVSYIWLDLFLAIMIGLFVWYSAYLRKLRLENLNKNLHLRQRRKSAILSASPKNLGSEPLAGVSSSEGNGSDIDFMKAFLGRGR